MVRTLQTSRTTTGHKCAGANDEGRSAGGSGRKRGKGSRGDSDSNSIGSTGSVVLFVCQTETEHWKTRATQLQSCLTKVVKDVKTVVQLMNADSPLVADILNLGLNDNPPPLCSCDPLTGERILINPPNVCACGHAPASGGTVHIYDSEDSDAGN